MNPLYIYFCLFITVFRSAFADISLGSLDSSYTASDTIDLEWVDDGSTPKDSDLSTATILLCTGPNASPHCFSSNPIASKSSISDMDGSYKIDVSKIADLGGNGPYYLQMTALVSGSSGYTIHYSTRFKLTGMTGSYAATDGGDITSPSSEKYLSDDADAATIATGLAWSSSISVTYTAQTGGIRYAPMQMQPGTTITRSLKASARYPTSAVSSYFTAVDSAPFCSSTITPSWSYTWSELTNYASPMAMPTKYYAASAIRASSIIAKASQKKRWMDY